MEPLTALLDWSRAQFALTACYHWLFVPLTLGLAVIMGIMETIYVVKGGEVWKRTAQFWMKLFRYQLRHRRGYGIDPRI